MNRTITLNRFPPQNYINRELGLLAFNRRVLAQALDERTPLLERLRFLCIVSSNMDEFFEIRVAGLKEQIKARSHTRTTDGKTAQEVLKLVSAESFRPGSAQAGKRRVPRHHQRAIPAL